MTSRAVLVIRAGWLLALPPLNFARLIEPVRVTSDGLSVGRIAHPIGKRTHPARDVRRRLVQTFHDEHREPTVELNVVYAKRWVESLTKVNSSAGLLFRDWES